MPRWPWSRPRPEPELPAVEGRHRFRIQLASAEQRDAALVALAGRSELAAQPVEDDPAAIDVASTFSPRVAAVLRPLYALEQTSVGVLGFEAHDLIAGVEARVLERMVADWARFANTGASRRRIEALSGAETLEECLRRLRAGGEHAAAWRFATTCVAFNTRGAEARMVSAAVDETNEQDANAFVGAAFDRAQLARLTSAPYEATPEQLAALIGRSGYPGERAAELALLLPKPWPAVVAQALAEREAATSSVEWPRIERDGDTFVVHFEETELSEARERFDDLAEAHPRVRLLEADREWARLVVNGKKPEALIRRLWEQASR
jgi:hypothetical protein